MSCQPMLDLDIEIQRYYLESNSKIQRWPKDFEFEGGGYGERRKVNWIGRIGTVEYDWILEIGVVGEHGQERNFPLANDFINRKFPNTVFQTLLLW